MAIWQFTVALVPKSWIDQVGTDMHDLLVEGGYETSLAWTDCQPKVDVDKIVSAVFPRSDSWHTDVLCWGNEKETDVQVGYDDGQVESVRVRIDARKKVGVVCSKIVEIANSLECVFFAPESKSIIAPNIFDLVRSISVSSAAKFAENPQAFVEALKIEHVSEE